MVSRQDEQDVFQICVIKFKRVDNVVVKSIKLNYQDWSLYDCSYRENEVKLTIHELHDDSYKCKIFLSDDRILSVPFRKHVICTVGKCCMCRTVSIYNTNCLLFCTEKYKPEVDNADRACEVCILTEGLYFKVRITNS